MTETDDILLPAVVGGPCPICNAKVYLVGVDEWETESGKIVEASFECETEPDIDGDDWPSWHRGHYAMPYVDWLPWNIRTIEELNEHYRYVPADPSSPARLETKE